MRRRTTPRSGITVRHLVRPVARAGCYAPGGRARYPSTVLMCAVPARVAGVEEIVLCVPPGPDGSVDDATLAAAAVAGVDEVYRVGGAQAIAAMAYGTETHPGRRRDRRSRQPLRGRGQAPGVGGGRGAVGLRRALGGGGGRRSGRRRAELAAIDLVVQAEHGPDGLAWLVTWSEGVADAVDGRRRPDRRRVAPAGEISRPPSARGGYAVLVDGPARPWRSPTWSPPSTSSS